ncbi:MAG: anion transporter [Planctomycetes bacterium]|nr:anion transporter [Planctomycetota bacterium]
MDPLPLILFSFTYLGMALGRIPGLKLDRTGFAILGAVAFLATGEMSLEQAKEAVDAPTIVVLWGMMLLSVQYQMSGLYTAIGDRLAAAKSPRKLLAGTIVVAALLAAVLTNDVICFAMTPLVASAILRTRQDPLPYLLALACATNIGSALTPIGNPQNILITQKMGLDFLPFVLACALPVALSLGFLHFFLARQLRERDPNDAPPAEPATPRVPLDRREAAKAIALTVAAIVLFLIPAIPAPLTALAIAGVVLTSRRMHTRAMLALVDWQMLALFAGLFIVVHGLEVSGWTDAASRGLDACGADLSRPFVFIPAAVVLGNLVGNVPTVMLLLPFLPSDAPTGHGLALASTFAGNAVLVGSVANIIVAEQAERLGIRIGFARHLRVGLPVTLVSLALALGAAILLW